jgi:hypothetical protein
MAAEGHRRIPEATPQHVSTPRRIVQSPRCPLSPQTVLLIVLLGACGPYFGGSWVGLQPIVVLLR